MTRITDFYAGDRILPVGFGPCFETGPETILAGSGSCPATRTTPLDQRIGLSHAGAVACGCLTDPGHRGIGVELALAKAASVAEARSPRHGAGLDVLLKSAGD